MELSRIYTAENPTIKNQMGRTARISHPTGNPGKRLTHGGRDLENTPLFQATRPGPRITTTLKLQNSTDGYVRSALGDLWWMCVRARRQLVRDSKRFFTLRRA